MIYPDGGLYEGYFKADKFDGMVSFSHVCLTLYQNLCCYVDTLAVGLIG